MGRSDGHIIHVDLERGLGFFFFFFFFYVHTMYYVQIFQLEYWYEILNIVDILQNIVL